MVAVRVFLLLSALVSTCLCAFEVCQIANKNERFDCHPDPNPTFDNCKRRGCCWQPNESLNEGYPVGKLINVPYCYYPKDYPTYNVTSWEETSYGYSASLSRSVASSWPNDIKQLTLDIWFETPKRLHFKIYDSASRRYEVPVETPQKPKTKAVNPEYEVKYRASPFGITVSRKSSGAILFDSTLDTAPLTFADQFIQITTRLSSELLYGLGGRKAHLLHNASDWHEFTMWARDQQPTFNSNLYGTHPFFLNVEKDGQTHGVFLLNSNAMDVDVQPAPAVTFRTIGGVLDFYVFTGPTASSVVKQYTEVIGLPQMPPYWALGFHLCRYNYGSVTKLKEVIERNRKLQIPYEVQWNDIDYMKEHLDFTYDMVNYAGLPDVVKDLHDQGQKYMIILDPGISNVQNGSYRPYETGLKEGIFVLDVHGKPIVGQVWPGSTVFPDFTHPKADSWWYNTNKEFHDVLPFDGLWIDMNEPSNFVHGSLTGCTLNHLDVPPFVPGVSGNGDLSFRTLCPSAQHHLSSHYNVHNVYALAEANATNRAMHKILGKRSLVISRSSFPSLGRHAGHWSGDISSTWEDLYYSIPAILEYQFYGIPMVGADICGFAHDTTEELCVRWMQLGAFYPFMRNHNDDRSRDQDPGAFSPAAQKYMKEVLEFRYLLLPYFYTRFYLSHTTGEGVIQPLFFRYPNDSNTYAIDRQFMWGSELLISPVLDQGATTVLAYLPRDLWYDLYTGEQLTGHGHQELLKAPMEKINVHIRGGSILPVQLPAVTTTIARKNPFALTVAFDASGLATGSLFLDDGDSLDTVKNGFYAYLQFEAEQGSITSTIIHRGYKPASKQYLDQVFILGVPKPPVSATVNGEKARIEYEADVKMLHIDSFSADLLQKISIKWQ